MLINTGYSIVSLLFSLKKCFLNLLAAKIKSITARGVIIGIYIYGKMSKKVNIEVRGNLFLLIYGYYTPNQNK